MKVLVIHASAGAGHRVAAEAIFQGLQQEKGISAVLADGLDYTSPFFKWVYQQTYTFLISYIPWVWGWFFGLADIRILLPVIKFLRRMVNGLNASKLEEFLKRERFDYIIATHFFPIEVASQVKGKGEIASKIICVITDYDAHSIWLAPGVDRYCGACDFTKSRLMSLGVDASRIVMTGIPIFSQFIKKEQKFEIRKKLGIRQEAFTVLIATGSFGIGPIEDVVSSLKDVQCLVVCGKNKSLFERLRPKEGELLHIYGLVNNMHELMSAADCLITKPGGLSITEALAKNLPLIFFHSIPGQESNNIKVLKTYGIGIGLCPIPQMVKEIEKWRLSPDLYQLEIQRIELFKRPHAVSDIIKLFEPVS